ncbi:Spherulation-specific family 4 [Dendryphion nanum]|uniref:Spherulation-specific family 4 n=1 Tax=Dendryphion nanum TaxID=256645 RepID=A0A9P9E8Z5_9PLEO|nr:Spherulation-specific family 4 [Dendryphion nanum]
MSILVPLYIYPWAGVWDPMYWVANTNPHINFSVIVNPCSGPCIASKPEDVYITELPKLKNYPNIKTLGYVATNYTNKPLESVLAEIDTYAKWPQLLGDERFAVDGIFFDETPGAYDWRWHDYLKRAAEQVKTSPGLGKRTVIHNPGTIPYIPWNYLDIADVTVVFEETFAKYIDATTFNNIKNLPANSNLTKDHFAVMIHTVPNIPDELVEWVARQLKNTVGWSFLSSVGAADAWHSFSTLFGPYINKFGALK